MKKSYVVLIAILLFVVPCIVSFAADEVLNLAEPKEIELKEVEKEETIEEKQKRHDLIIIDLRKRGPIIPIKRGPKAWLENKIDWTLENFVRHDGWQLTGWSKMKLDEDFNISRWKFGIISPEIIGARIEGDVDPRHETEWEKYQKSRDSIIIGVCWSKEFGSVTSSKAKKNNDIERYDYNRMLAQGDYYRKRGGERPRNAALFIYGELIRKYPGTAVCVLAQDRIKKMQKRR
jgi:hypothetical protein